MSMNNFRNSSSRQDQSSGRSRRDESSPLKADVAIVFYSDTEKTKLKHDVFYTRAEEDAEKFGNDRVGKQLTSAQLRRFFGEMKGYYQRWRNQSKSEEAFEILLPLIKMMKSKIYYAVNEKKPQNSKIPHSFASFLLGGIAQIKDSKDFEAFILYFESVVGFLYGKGLVR